MDKRIQLKCTNCGGTLLVEEEKMILSCPYCEAKELIVESDVVKVEKIKSEAYKEVEFGKQRIELEKMQLELQREKKQEEKERIEAFKKGKLSKVLIICAIFCFLMAIGGFNNCKYNAEYLFSSIIGLVQGILFCIVWFMGSGVIKHNNSNLYGIFMFVAFVLFIPFMMLIP